jgi:hypothetical protein
MRALCALLLSLLAGVLIAMSMAIYLPLEQVNKMFISALASPIVITALSVWSLRADSLKAPLIFFAVSIPVLLAAVVMGLMA